MNEENIVKVYEGSYQYFDKGNNYSQENFHVTFDKKKEHYKFHAEILSRVSSGEFFKILVVYELNHYFAPLFMSVDRFLGEKQSSEIYKIDTLNQVIEYTFKTPLETKVFTRPISTKHQLQSPAMCTSTLFLQSKKIDQMAKFPVTFITCQNEWEYIGPPEDKVLFIEFKSHDVPDFQISGVHVPATWINVYQTSNLMGSNEQPTAFYVSKHVSIPYSMQAPDGITVTIQKLKNTKVEDIKFK